MPKDALRTTRAKHLELAISNPCRISSEAAHPKFGYLIPGASVVLTVNSGYE